MINNDAKQIAVIMHSFKFIPSVTYTVGINIFLQITLVVQVEQSVPCVRACLSVCLDNSV